MKLLTPAMVIDATVVRQNIERLGNYATSVGLDIRPHTKTHKSRRLAKLQLEAGAIGITAAKLGEAEVISGEGEDLLLAYPPVDASRSQRLAILGRDRTVRAAIDSILAIKMTSAAAQSEGVTIGLLVDVDVGMGRTGVQTPAQSLTLAHMIDRMEGVRLDGIMCYPGQIWDKPDQQSPALKAVDAILEEVIDLWDRDGLDAPIVSGGSTPTAYQSHIVSHLTEIRSGTYVYNDMNTVRGGFCDLDSCAARIVCTVISNAVPGQVVIDAGSKTLTSDRCVPAPDSGHGYVVDYPNARITHLSEEHGQIDITSCEGQPNVGERLTLIPNHICPCVNLQDAVWWIESDQPPQPLVVDARGKLT